MIRIAVCDDSPEFLQQAVNMVERWSEESGVPAEIYRFDNGDALLAKNAVTHMDIIFLDIIMPLQSGIDTAKELRQSDKAVKIIFLTSSPEFALDSYEVKAQDYLLKPVDYEEFGACIDHLRISIFERGAARTDEQEEGRTILQLTRYLQEHLQEEISLNLLADTFHLSAAYISQLFKSEIGVNFLSYLTNIRMERAKKLLVSTDLPIAEVAEKSGYADYRVFAKAFKKAEGATPSQYRRDFEVQP